jgi:hypothetical protein
MFSKRRGPSTSRRTQLRLLVVASCLTGVLAPATAQAAVDLQVKPPTLSGTSAVGDTGTGELTIANGTTAPQDAQNFVLSEITLVPSCGKASADKECALSPGADPGVITIGPTATGSGACGGRTFTVSTIDIVSGRVTFAPSAEVSLASSGNGATCVITFNYTVSKMATKDTVVGGTMQTDLVAWAKGYALADPVPREEYEDVGNTHVTISKDSPTLLTRASDPVDVGGELSVAGTLTGTHPDGTIFFDLYDPTAPTCTGLPAYSTTLTVNGNGTYRSPVVPATKAGTYRWTARYDGDDDNNGVDSVCSDPVASTLVSAPVTPPPPPPSDPGGGGTIPGTGGTTPGTGATTPGTGGTTPGISGGTTPGTGVQRVRLDGFALTRRTFARATKATVLAANAAYVAPKAKKKKATAKGTTIKYKLSAPATVTMVVERVTKGRRAGGYANKCVKATAKLKKKKAKTCTLYTKVSTLKRVHKSAGAKKVAFSGRAGKKLLAAGSYRIRATAAAGAGTASAERRTTFKIVKR